MSLGPLNFNPLLMPWSHHFLKETKWKMSMVSLYYLAKTNIYTAEKYQGVYVPFVSEENTNMEVNKCSVEVWTGFKVSRV